MMLSRICFWSFAVNTVLLLVPTHFAHGCGLTPPIGPNGLPTVCHGKESAWRYHAGLTLGGTDTRIDAGGRKADLQQAASVVSLDVMPIERLGLSVAGGTSLGGQVSYEGQDFDLAPGPIGGLGISYLFLGKTMPFIHLSLTLSLSEATATAQNGSTSTFTSKDWRVGTAIGKTFGTVAAPFLVARYFGGGTDWSVFGKGGDHYRYHIGMGCAFSVNEHVDLLVEAAFLGERRATMGVGYLF